MQHQQGFDGQLLVGSCDGFGQLRQSGGQAAPGNEYTQAGFLGYEATVRFDAQRVLEYYFGTETILKKGISIDEQTRGDR